ncbi:MAG TPA: 23S rRNA (pseudouridine(1915)-N(3))-methyltransferase RlmH [Acetobacteraceae bacterium]
MLHLIAVGKLPRGPKGGPKGGPEAELFARYVARLRLRLVLTEVAEARGAAAEVRRREGAALRAAVPTNGFVVALDLGGTETDSEGFAALVERWLVLGRPVCFLVGGAEGLDKGVLARADHVLSLGALTWPHLLVRVMLVEQLFRARSIAAGHPYHRDARP